MSRGQIATVAIATLIGIGNGYYVFNPLLREQQDKQENPSGAVTKTSLVAPTTPSRRSNDVLSTEDTSTELSTEAMSATSTWDRVRNFAAKSFEPGDLRKQWAKGGEER